MPDVRDAFAAATSAIKTWFPDTTGLRLEEIELLQGSIEWHITLSFLLPKTADPANIFVQALAPQFESVYKNFVVNKQTADVTAMKIRPDLRHGVAMEVLEQRHDLEQVRALLGHTRIDTTQIYTMIRPAQLKQAVSFYEEPARQMLASFRRDDPSMFEEHLHVPQTRSLKPQQNQSGGPNGI